MYFGIVNVLKNVYCCPKKKLFKAIERQTIQTEDISTQSTYKTEIKISNTSLSSESGFQTFVSSTKTNQFKKL